MAWAKAQKQGGLIILQNVLAFRREISKQET